jgi:hypothetical protein
MAVKKSLLSGSYSLNDLYDTQNALDSGAINKVETGTKSWSAQQSFLGIKGKSVGGTSSILGDKDNFASLLSTNDSLSVGAYKKRKSEQTNLRSQGVGQSQSVLSGTVI